MRWLERGFFIFLFFPLSLHAHRGRVDRVIEVLLEERKIVVEVLQYIYTYSRDYDILRASMDADMSGAISEEEAQSFGEKFSFQNILFLDVRYGNDRVKLKYLNSKVEEYPERVNDARNISVWMKYEGELNEDSCENFFIKDKSTYHRGIFRIRVKRNCVIKEVERGSGEKKEAIVEFHGREKWAVIKLMKEGRE